MPKCVRMQRATVRERKPLQDAACVTRREPAPPQVHEERVGRLDHERLPRACRTYVVDGVGRGIAERQAPDLGTFSQHRDGPAAQVDVADVEAAALAHPQPGAVEELEHREVAPRDRGRPCPRSARAADADGGQPSSAAASAPARNPRQLLAPLGRAQIDGDVAASAPRAAAGSARTRAPPPRSGRSSAARSPRVWRYAR